MIVVPAPPWLSGGVSELRAGLCTAPCTARAASVSAANCGRAVHGGSAEGQAHCKYCLCSCVRRRITPFSRRENSPRELVTLRRSHIYREQGPWIPEPVPQRPPSPLCQWLLGADRGEPSSTGFAGSPRGAHSCSEALTAQLHSDLDQGHLSGDEKGPLAQGGHRG